jgi:hypothetical protein
MSGAHSRALIAPKVGSACLGVLLSFLAARQLGPAGVVGAGGFTNLVYMLWVLALARLARTRLSLSTRTL